MSTSITLGSYLVAKGIISEDALVRAGARAAADASTLEAALLATESPADDDLITAIAEFYRLPLASRGDLSPSPEAIAAVPAGFATRHALLPLKLDNGVLEVAVAPGFDPLSLSALRVNTGLPARPVIAKHEHILDAIKKYYGVGADTVERIVEDRRGQLEIIGAETPEPESRELVDTAPVVRFVDQLILEALKDRATDIHIEPFEHSVRIRNRIDGVLFETPAPPGIKRIHASIVSRIKIMAEMDIAEKRLPQDGRVKLRVAGEELDLRVSTIPTPFGESVGIRLLRRSMMLMGLQELGMPESALARFRSLIRNPNGIILVTGPTGSGKTTTLYSALNEINTSAGKIITIEDPIEYMLHGVNQIQVKPAIGLTFASGLRSVLRHDPDVIMVGEIRDPETAEIAIRAALTGHLVFSTLHTNDAPGAIARLLDMGIEPYLVASSVRAVLAQRLVRTLCPHCREQAEYKPSALRESGIAVKSGQNVRLWEAAGCPHCRQQGYTGRTGIYELLAADDAIRALVSERATADTIRARAVSSGMSTLRDDGWDKALRGITSLEEVLRATRED